jgi:hypothetical protein
MLTRRRASIIICECTGSRPEIRVITAHVVMRGAQRFAGATTALLQRAQEGTCSGRLPIPNSNFGRPAFQVAPLAHCRRRNPRNGCVHWSKDLFKYGFLGFFDSASVLKEFFFVFSDIDRGFGGFGFVVHRWAGSPSRSRGSSSGESLDLPCTSL